jgi:hypothetical protein
MLQTGINKVVAIGLDIYRNYDTTDYIWSIFQRDGSIDCVPFVYGFYDYFCDSTKRKIAGKFWPINAWFHLQPGDIAAYSHS